MADDSGTTASEFEDAFIKGNEAKLRNDKRYYQMFEDLRAMGLSDSEMRRVLKDSNIGSSARKVMRGQFDPFKVSSKNRKEMRKAGTQDEFRLVSKRINEIRKLMRGASLAPDDDPGARDPDTTTKLEEVPATPFVPIPAAPTTSAPTRPFVPIPQRLRLLIHSLAYQHYPPCPQAPRYCLTRRTKRYSAGLIHNIDLHTKATEQLDHIVNVFGYILDDIVIV